MVSFALGLVALFIPCFGGGWLGLGVWVERHWAGHAVGLWGNKLLLFRGLLAGMVSLCGGFPGWCGGLFVNCIVDVSIFWFLFQVFKSIRWMPWHQEPKKDVVACDMPRGVGKRAVIRGCPNGETRPESCLVTRA